MATEVTHNATSGHYTWSWDGNDLGKSDEGWVWEVSLKGEVLRFEEWGDTAIDMIHRGAEVFIEATLKEWLAAGLRAALWPWGSVNGKLDCVGEFAVDGSYAKPLVGTAESCNPAGAGDGPATITFHNTIFAPDVAQRINLDNNPRVVPIRFMCFLTDTNPTSAVDARFWTET